MNVVPLNGSHLAGIVALHRATRPWCYRGKDAKGVLRAFYDAYANRDYTVGTVAVEEGGVVAAACGTTDLEGPARWLRRRRRWRSLWPRLVGGADMALGGWDGAALARASAGFGRPGYLLAAATAGGLTDADVADVFAAFAAAMASRGAACICAPTATADERLVKAGFELGRGGSTGTEDGFVFYVRLL